MNRKLVNGLLLVALASGGCGVFTSCKDTNEDFYNKTVLPGQIALGQRVEDLEKYTGYVKGWTETIPDMIKAGDQKLRDELIPRLEALENNGASKDDVDAVKDEIQDLIAQNAALKGDLTALQNTVAALEEKLKDYKPGVTEQELNDAIQGLQVILEQQINTLKSDLEAVKTDVESLKTGLETVKTEVATVSADLSQLRTEFNADHETLLQTVADVATNAEKIEALTTSVDELTSTVDNLALEFGDLYNDINGKGGLKDDVRNLNAQLALALESIANNEADIDNLYQLVEGNQQSIKDLQNLTAKYFGNINDVLNRRVSDILLNQTWNPMFGAINLPIGLATTVAANYYGYADHNLNFPLSVESAEYDVLHENSGLNKIGQSAIDNLLATIKGGQEILTANKHYMNDGENNLGQLYLSVNPTHIDTKNINFELVASNGEKAPVDVNVVETDEKLTFGVSRSASNGFYRANLHVDAENAPAIGIRVEEGLKSAMKDALTSHTKSDFVQLAKVLAKQMENILPAYGVKATWEEPGLEFPNASESVTRTYISQYNIAATSFRPLGYDFMHGQGASSDVLPTIGSIQQIFNDFFNDLELDFKIDFNEIKGLNIKGLDLTIEIDDIDLGNPEIIIDLAGIEVKGDRLNENGVMEYDVVIGKIPDGTEIKLTYDPSLETPVQGEGALNEFINNITTQINGMLGDIEGQINDDLIKEVNKLIEEQIQGQVNDMLADINSQLQGINGQITESIDKIKDQIKNSLAGKLGKLDNLVDKYNQLANKINDMLKNPNQYLQVLMAYETKGNGLGILSSDINHPTHFKMAGGNAVSLFATSYTAELIAPSYKKYVAVSRAWTKSGSEVGFNDQIGGPAKANETEFLNEVRPGNQQRFVLDVNNLQKGYKYEVIYSSLDYQGYTSTRTFYFVVD